MKGFWANEWDLFLKYLDVMADFLTQPVTFDGIFGKNDPMLKPSPEEIQEKGQMEQASGFWANEWNLFLKDLDVAADFLFKPVQFK